MKKTILFTLFSLLIAITTIAFGNKYLQESWLGRALLETNLSGILSQEISARLWEMIEVNSVSDTLNQYETSLTTSFTQLQSSPDRIFADESQSFVNPQLSVFGTIPDIQTEDDIIKEKDKSARFVDIQVSHTIELSNKTLEWLHKDNDLSDEQAYHKTVYQKQATPTSLEKTCQYLIDRSKNSSAVKVGELQYAILLSQAGNTKLQAEMNKIDANRRLIKVLRNKTIIDENYYRDLSREKWISRLTE
jgi:hypothetical protein